MGRPENLTVPQGKEPSIANANSKAVTLKKKISLLVKDGTTFPALVEIKRLLALPNPMGIYKELARATAKAKISELSDFLVELENACAHLATLVLSLGEGLNEKEALDAGVEEVNFSYETYAALIRTALCALAPASGTPPPTPATAPRAELNKFMKISSTAEPSHLPHDISLIFINGC